MKILIVLASFAVLALARPKPNSGPVPPRRLSIPNAHPVAEASDNVPVLFPAPKNIVAPRNYVPNQYEKEQNQAARYEFMSDVEDHINDLTQQRTEVRDGLSVRGMYSYSDGYYKRTVHYTADENGYRVTGMEAVPLQDGPQVDLSGTASVSNAAHGTHLSYKVQSVPVPGPVAKIVDRA